MVNVTVYECPKCGRKNRVNFKEENAMFVKCQCGKILLNKVIGIQTIKNNERLNI